MLSKRGECDVSQRELISGEEWTSPEQCFKSRDYLAGIAKDGLRRCRIEPFIGNHCGQIAASYPQTDCDDGLTVVNFERQVHLRSLERIFRLQSWAKKSVLDETESNLHACYEFAADFKIGSP